MPTLKMCDWLVSVSIPDDYYYMSSLTGIPMKRNTDQYALGIQLSPQSCCLSKVL